MEQEKINKILLKIKANDSEILNLNYLKNLLENRARRNINLAITCVDNYRVSKKNKSIRIIKQIYAILNNHIPRNRSIWSHKTFVRFWESEVPTFSEKQFKERFRMNRKTFYFLVEKVGVYVKKQDTNWRKAIPVSKRIAVAIYALGSSAEYATIGHLFGIGRTTVGEITLEVCEAINTMQSQYINGYPPTDSKIIENIKGFENTWGMPQCYAAIDGCHIEISPPEDEATDYYNYKGWYSTVLFAAVDYRYRFIYINVGSPGRNNDAFIYANSKLKAIHDHNDIFKKYAKIIDNVEVPVLIIADSALPLARNLMKPYPHHNVRNDVEFKFNHILSRSRRVVENAFGHLKARFRRIGKGMEVHISNTNTIIRACCILHNICNEANDKFNDSWLTDEGGREQPNFISSVGERVFSAMDTRRTLAEFLFRNQ